MVELVCAACGRKDTVKSRGGRKYCDECKGLSYSGRARIRKELAEAAEAAAAQTLKERRERDPFDPALMNDKRLGAVIKMFGMTYGTYTAAHRGGILIPLLKDKGFADPEKMLRKLEED